MEGNEPIPQSAMLEPWEIEEIRRREEEAERQREERRPRLEIEIETPGNREADERRSPAQPTNPPKSDRGVTIIDFGP